MNKTDMKVSSKPSALSSRKYSMMDLFAGCGGLSLGFEQAGFIPVFVSELNDDARATYLNNRHHLLGNRKFSECAEFHCGDAHELTSSRLREIKNQWKNIEGLDFSEKDKFLKNSKGSTLDIVVGGPPCQGYSGIGIRRSYSVDRQVIPSNQLYQIMANVIRNTRPRVFLFENVRGLLNAKWTQEGKEPIWPDVKAEFCSIKDYDVRWSLVYAKDYGVPQNRPRVLLVGIRKDISTNNPLVNLEADLEDAVKCGLLPKPRPGEYPDIEVLLGDLLDDSIVDKLNKNQYPVGAFKTSKYPKKPALNTIQEYLRTDPDGNLVTKLTDHEYSKHAPRIVSKFRHMLENDGEIPEKLKTKKFAQRILPRKWNNREPFITATSLPDDYVHYNQPRVLSVREWARLQLFPDWYQFSGKRTTGGLRRAGNPRQGIFDREVPKYTQIGNAVPVGLAREVAKHLKGIIDEVIKF